MSKQIIVESKNGTYNIEKSRQATNESNLIEDREKWKTISQCEEDSTDKNIKSVIKGLKID